MDLPPLPPPPALITYADVAFHHPDATLPDYPRPRQGTAYVPTPSPAEIEQARKFYPENPIEALRHEAALLNWSTRSRSPNYCPARKEAPPVRPVFGNDRPGEALRYNVCISSPGDIPGVVNQNVQTAALLPFGVIAATTEVAKPILGLPANLIRAIGHIR